MPKYLILCFAEPVVERREGTIKRLFSRTKNRGETSTKAEGEEKNLKRPPPNADIQDKKDLSYDEQASVLKARGSFRDYQSLLYPWALAEAHNFVASGRLADPSESSQVLVKYLDYPDAELQQQLRKLNTEPVPEAKDLIYPSPLTSIIRGPVQGATLKLVSFYLLKKDSIDEVVEWLRSLPSFTSGLTYEIREVKEGWPWDRNEDLMVEQVVKVREKMMQAGKIRKDPDGTFWRKIDHDFPDLAEKITEAEQQSEILNPKT